MGRALLGVSPNVANDAIRGDLGWWTMKGRSDLAKLRLWGKILNTDHSHLLFQVYKTRRAEYTQFNYIKSWCHDIHQLLVKLGLGTCWDTEEVGSMKDWVKLIKTTIAQNEAIRNKIQIVIV